MNPRTRNFLIVAIAIVLIVGIGLFLFLRNHQIPYSGTEELTKRAGLVIVLPNPLPRGFLVADQPSYNPETKSIATRITTSGRSITLSQQARPDTDLDQVDAQDTFLVNAGSVYVLKGEKGRLQAIVETEDSWLMVNAEESIGYSTFKKILESLGTI